MNKDSGSNEDAKAQTISIELIVPTDQASVMTQEPEEHDDIEYPAEVLDKMLEEANKSYDEANYNRIAKNLFPVKRRPLTTMENRIESNNQNGVLLVCFQTYHRYFNNRKIELSYTIHNAEPLHEWLTGNILLQDIDPEISYNFVSCHASHLLPTNLLYGAPCWENSLMESLPGNGFYLISPGDVRYDSLLLAPSRVMELAQKFRQQLQLIDSYVLRNGITIKVECSEVTISNIHQDNLLKRIQEHAYNNWLSMVSMNKCVYLTSIADYS